MFAWRRLDTHRLVIAILFAGIFAMAARVPFDADVWWHLAGGRLIAQSGMAPASDPFSWSVPGRPWIDNGWLWQLALYALYAATGTGGLVALVALAATAACACVYAVMDGSPYTRAAVCVLAAAAAAPVWSARPQMATFVLTAVAQALVWRFVTGGRARELAWLVPLTVLWVNLHAGFVALYVVLGAAWLGLVLEGRVRPPGPRRGQAWSLVAVGAASLLVVPLNPYGVAMWTYPFYNAGQAFARAYISEWASPDFHQTVAQPFLVLLLALVGALALSPRRPGAVELITVLAFAALALQAQRGVGLFALAAAPVLARQLAALEPAWLARPAAPSRAAALVNWGLLAVVVLAAALKAWLPATPASTAQALQAMNLPVAAQQWLARERPAARLFNDYNWGGYLIWTGYPPRQVFIDGRADLYGDPFLFEYIDIAAARGEWRAALARYGVDTVLAPPDSALARALAREPGWRLAFGGDGEPAVVFTR
jgi:hypothetical protein